jgi:hypothetical protein
MKNTPFGVFFFDFSSVNFVATQKRIKTSFLKIMSYPKVIKYLTIKKQSK